MLYLLQLNEWDKNIHSNLLSLKDIKKDQQNLQKKSIFKPKIKKRQLKIQRKKMIFQCDQQSNNKATMNNWVKANQKDVWGKLRSTVQNQKKKKQAKKQEVQNSMAENQVFKPRLRKYRSFTQNRPSKQTQSQKQVYKKQWINQLRLGLQYQANKRCSTSQNPRQRRKHFQNVRNLTLYQQKKYSKSLHMLSLNVQANINNAKISNSLSYQNRY